MVKFAASAPVGAVLSTDHMGRRMKAYAITEGEMDHISLMNTLATGAFSAASFCVALIGGIYTNAAFVPKDQTPATGLVLTGYGIPLLGILAGLFVVGGVFAVLSKQSTWARIKRESEPMSQATSV